jgi:sugar lactone lactonase YvrE
MRFFPVLVVAALSSCHRPISCSQKLAPAPAPAVGQVDRGEEDEAPPAEFGPKIPPDARHIRTPPWAKLEAVWGLYDPPLVNSRRLVQAAFMKDDRRLFLLGGQGDLWIWNRVQHKIEQHIDVCIPAPSDGDPSLFRVEHLVTSSDELVAVGFAAGRFCVVDLATGRLAARIETHVPGHFFSSVSVARLVGGTLVTYGYSRPSDPSEIRSPEAGGELRSWDARTGSMRSDVNIGRADAAAISPDGRHIALSSDKLRLRDLSGRTLWESKGLRDLTGTPPWASERRAVRIAFATPEKLLVTDGTNLFTMSARNGALGNVFDGYWHASEDNPYKDIVVTPDGRRAISDIGFGWTLWDVDTGREVGHSRAETGHFVGLAASSDGSMFVNHEGMIFATGTLALLESPRGPTECLGLSGDAQHVVACHRGQIDLWDGRSAAVQRWPREDTAFVSLSNDGTRVLVREREKNALREWPTGRVLWSAPHYLWAPATLSPDGARLAVLVWEQARKRFAATLIDLSTNAVVWKDEKENLAGRILSFSPDGRTLLAHDWNKRLVTFQAADGAVLRHVGPIDEGDFTFAGGGRAVLGLHRSKRLVSYDLETGQAAWQVQETHWRNGVAAAGDRRALVEFNDTCIRLRDLETGKSLGEPIDLAPSADAPLHLATSSDGGTLVVGTERGVLLRFKIDVGDR